MATFHDGDVDLIVLQHRIKIINRVGLDRDAHVLVLLGILRQHLRDHVALGGVGDAHAQSVHAALLVPQGLLQILVQRHHALGVLDHQLAVRGGADLAPAAHEQADAQLLFDLLDVLAHRGLGQGELLRRAGVVAGFMDLQKGQQLHVYHSGSLHNPFLFDNVT